MVRSHSRYIWERWRILKNLKEEFMEYSHNPIWHTNPKQKESGGGPQGRVISPLDVGFD